MDNLQIAVIILGTITIFFSVIMLVAKSPVTSALSLLGILLCTAGIYGLMSEHFIATIQLVVYAGAIMVLFIFSIMLLNLKNEARAFDYSNTTLFIATALGVALLGGIVFALFQHFSIGYSPITLGSFTHDRVAELGGNAKVLSHALFSQFYISFEVISLALLVAVVGSVVLAKRHFD